MANETLAPDAIAASIGLSGSVTDIDESTASLDANWMVATNNNTSTECRVTFPSPSGDLTVGADLQSFVVAVREYDSGQTGTPDARLELWKNGVLVRAGTDVPVTSNGQLITLTWNASEVSNIDGSVVECKFVGTKTGGSPSTRNTVDLGALEWVAEYDAAPAIEELQPDAMLGKSAHFTGTFEDVNDPVSNPGTDCMTANITASEFHWLELSFPTPSGNLQTGAGLQKFQIYVKRSGTNVDALNLNMRLEESGVDLGSIGNQSCTSTTGEILEITWDAALLSNLDGSNVEVRIQSTSKGSDPFDGIDIGGFTWIPAVSSAPILGLSASGA